MGNVTIKAPLVDGSLMDYVDETDSSDEVVIILTGDDLRPPAVGIKITVRTESGKKVEIYIPNNSQEMASVSIDNLII
ncbi:hypothetical protein [Yersinia alsatica]|uniref:hypothetical protein n=1 Tax=Yersinia alsatica TaxID=2890317 RepID=UPI0011A41FC6|nr:hypothetical protein [Yersinia alsatica]